MSIVRAVVRPNTYVDSLTLLQVSSRVAGLPGVQDAALVMGTPLNQEVLRTSGLLTEPGNRSAAIAVGPNDLVLAVRADDASAAEAALRAAEHFLTTEGRKSRRAEGAGAGEEPPRSLRGAHRRAPGANLAVISVPGSYAAAEAHQALGNGLHVFLFSDNVSLADEVALKTRARAAGLLVMGPDCGTAIIGGVGLGFANVVRRGRIGLVGASGTGLQEVSVLLHQAGQGISHAIGTGGRDLHAEVGGITTLQALALLGDDPQTECIVLVSKPPAPEVAERVLHAAARTGKPVVACLLGANPPPPPGVHLAPTLAAAATLSSRLSGGPGARKTRPPRSAEDEGANGDEGLSHSSAPEHPLAASNALGQTTAARGTGGQRTAGHVRGLFCGGTLADEADLILADVPHSTVDLGADRYTQGRLHPMIDPSLRNQAILDAARDPAVGVLLLDVVLGYGAHANPAGVVAPVIRAAIERAAADGRRLAVLAHLLGTDQDPQPLADQQRTLAEAGAQLYASNAAAAEAARHLAA